MFIRKTTILAGGAMLSLALAAGSAQAQNNDALKTDPTVMKVEGEETAMTAEELEMAAEKAEMEGEAAMEKTGEAMENAAENTEEAMEEAEGAVADAFDDDETAAMLQQKIASHPELGVYGLDVIELDGRYQVTGMIDKPEDMATLQQMIGEVEGVDPSMIDNNVVQQ